MSAQDSSPIFSSFARDADMIELVQEFVADLQSRIASMRDAYQANDLHELSRLAHQLKGAGGGYGFEIISTAAAGLESASNTACSAAQVQRELEDLLVICHRATAGPPPA